MSVKGSVGERNDDNDNYFVESMNGLCCENNK